VAAAEIWSVMKPSLAAWQGGSVGLSLSCTTRS
jgi:hypothetical protein